MSIQRRRGERIKVWPVVATTDTRGNPGRLRPNLDVDPYKIRASVTPIRSSKAELPGQLDIEVYLVTYQDPLPGVESQSRIEWRGDQWDVTSTPVLHTGTRATRHWSLEMQGRPHGSAH